MMKATMILLGTTAAALAPTLASAQQTSTTTSTSLPSPTTGQPDQSCQDINGGNTGPSYPGNTTTAPGSAFNETDGIAGSVYAGNQPVSQKSSISVSQYDVACEMQPL
jgi:hypothetical protein